MAAMVPPLLLLLLNSLALLAAILFLVREVATSAPVTSTTRRTPTAILLLLVVEEEGRGQPPPGSIDELKAMREGDFEMIVKINQLKIRAPTFFPPFFLFLWRRKNYEVIPSRILLAVSTEASVVYLDRN